MERLKGRPAYIQCNGYESEYCRAITMIKETNFCPPGFEFFWRANCWRRVEWRFDDCSSEGRIVERTCCRRILGQRKDKVEAHRTRFVRATGVNQWLGESSTREGERGTDSNDEVTSK